MCRLSPRSFVCLKMVGVSDIFLRDLSLQDSVQDVLLGIIGYKMSTWEMSVSRLSIYRMSLYKMSMRNTSVFKMSACGMSVCKNSVLK